jgi:(1->4)-alpha-D-glucan 1-alpha-D-glucosylmutase
MYNSLSQTLLKLTVPGVPDIYQGTELWDLSLVDPDNRRPVDYERRSQLLQSLQYQIAAASGDFRSLVRELLERREDGCVKLYVIHRTLCYRRRQPELFLRGEYVPLTAVGPNARHICAFARRYGDRTLLVVVPRLFTHLIPDPTILPIGAGVWADTGAVVLPEWNYHCYRNVLTGETLRAVTTNREQQLELGEIFASFPLALLEAAEESGG